MKVQLFLVRVGGFRSVIKASKKFKSVTKASKKSSKKKVCGFLQFV